MIRDIHTVNAWLFIAANGLVGIWALGADRWPRFRGRVGWIAVIVAEIIVIVQVFLGVAIVMGNEVDNDQHQLYGFAAFASVGLIYAYRNEMKQRPYLLYGLGSLWLMGLGIRGMFLV